MRPGSLFLGGLVLFAATIIFLRDYHALERYRYLIAVASIILLFSPFLLSEPGQRRLPPGEPRPALLPAVRVREDRRSSSSSPSYLAENREMLSVAARKVLGVTIPPLKHFGPLLVVWGAAMLMLFFVRDLGSSLMFFGAFLAVLYVATSRLSYVIAGFGLFLAGAAFLAGRTPSRPGPRGHLARPVCEERARGRRPDPAVAVRTGRRRPVRHRARRVAAALPRALLPGHLQGGLPVLRRRSCRSRTRTSSTRSRSRRSGSSAEPRLILIYALIVARGFKTALMVQDAFSKLLAVGPHDGLRLPDVRDHRRRNQGHPADRRDPAVRLLRRNSVVANMILIALLLLISDERAEDREPQREPGDDLGTFA